MAQAVSEPSTKRPVLSMLFCDPVLREAFWRAERDAGELAPSLVPSPMPNRTGGAAVETRELAHV